MFITGMKQAAKVTFVASAERINEKRNKRAWICFSTGYSTLLPCFCFKEIMFCFQDVGAKDEQMIRWQPVSELREARVILVQSGTVVAERNIVV